MEEPTVTNYANKDIESITSFNLDEDNDISELKKKQIDKDDNKTKLSFEQIACTNSFKFVRKHQQTT